MRHFYWLNNEFCLTNANFNLGDFIMYITARELCNRSARSSVNCKTGSTRVYNDETVCGFFTVQADYE